MRILSLMGKILVVVVLVPLLVGGCDKLQKEVQTLRIHNRTIESLLIDKEKDIVALQERNRSLEGKINDFDVLTGVKNDLIQTLKDQNAALRADVVKKDADIRALIAQLGKLKTGVGGLPEKISIELEALQRAYPQLFSFDRATGQLRFGADLTFDFASAVVSANAREALTKLAAILSQEEARLIRISIVGHTDNVPVRKAETVRIHRNNQGLSEHRAEAVSDVLVAAGIEASRISTSGLGAAKPIADNRTQAGRARNRRVEIFLTMGP